MVWFLAFFAFHNQSLQFPFINSAGNQKNKQKEKKRKKRILSQMPAAPWHRWVGSNTRTRCRARQHLSSPSRLSYPETKEMKWKTDIFYYAYKFPCSFQVKWSLILSLDCQVTPVKKPHALRYNEQTLLGISAPRRNRTPRPRAGWSVTGTPSSLGRAGRVDTHLAHRSDEELK